MSGDCLPVEIFEIIFKNLDGRDLIKCRRVCRRWRDAVDFLDDTVWKKICEKNYSGDSLHDNLQNIHKKAGIAWRDLYNSMNLWSKIKSAEVTTKKLPVKNANCFTIFKNGAISILQHDSDPDTSNSYIVYYKLDTLEECGRENFGFHVIMFDENDNFIVGVDGNYRLFVLAKLNNKMLFGGHVQKCENVLWKNFHLLDNKVFYKNIDKLFCVTSMLKTKNGDVTLETEEYDECDALEYSDIVSIVPERSSEINLLTSRGKVYAVYLSNQEFAWLTTIRDDAALSDLAGLGFNWSCPGISNWVDNNFEWKDLCVTKLKRPTFLIHNKVIIVSSTSHMLRVYANAYGPSGSFKLYTAKPTISFDLTKLFNFDTDSKVLRMDVIEIVNGHRVIILLANEIFILEFVHKVGDGKVKKPVTKVGKLATRKRIGFKPKKIAK